MSTILYALGRWSYRHPWRVLVSWLLLLVLAASGFALFGKGTSNTFSIPGTEAQAGLEQLSRSFPQAGGTSAQIVVVAAPGAQVASGDYRDDIESTISRIEDLDGVLAVTDPFDENVSGLVSADGDAALVRLQFDGQSTDVPASTKSDLRQISDDLGAELPAGSQVALGGDLFAVSVPGVTLTEAVGLLIALFVLIVTFRSFAVAGLPLASAIIGVGLSLSLIMVSTAFTSISSTTPLLALMLGIAVGIDYALFIMARHQDQVRAGAEPEESAARSTGTAGSAVVFAGITVLIALIGLAFAGIPFLTTMGVAASVAVAIAVVVAVTLTPAFLGMLKGRVIGWRPRSRAARGQAPDRTPEHPGGRADQHAADSEAVPGTSDAASAGPSRVAARAGSAPGTADAASAGPSRVAAQAPRGFAARWVGLVTRHPVVTTVAVVLVLGVTAIPAGSLALALPNAGMLPAENEARQSYDLVGEHFGPGFNGPLIMTGTIVTSNDPLNLMKDLGAEIETLPGVETVALATPNETADTGIVQIIPTTAPDAPATSDLVRELRAQHDHFLDEYGVDLKVTGFTAVAIDISDRLGAALLPFGIFVVGLSLILLTIVFRSVWVPITAALGYLLSVLAAFGVVAAVFEWGWLADLIHVTRVGPVISFMPIVLMGVLFGLAMDYQVFLVSRMREDFVHRRRALGDGGRDVAIGAVRSGFTASARVVTAAAVIMFAVFAAFVPEGDASLKPIALGLAAGIAIDAVLVRMTLVPAVMALLGERAWSMPRWLDRMLPHLDIEGEAVERELALTDWPEPGSSSVVAGAGVGLREEGVVLYDGVALRVEPGDTLVVTGAGGRSIRALLLTLAGRMSPTDGTLKVAGHLLPGRAAWVRGHVGIGLLGDDGAEGAAQEVRRAFEGRPSLVVLDGLDTVSDESERDQVLAALREAAGVARAADRPLTVIAGGEDGERVALLLGEALGTAVDTLDLRLPPRADILPPPGSRSDSAPARETALVDPTLEVTA